MTTSLSVSVVEEEWTDVNSKLMGSTPQAILEWAVERFQPRLTMATAFGAEGCVLIHLLAEIDPKVRVFNLDTGYQFPETLALREQIRERYGIEVEMVRPETTTAEYEKAARRAGVCGASGPMLLRPEDCAVAAGAGGLRRVDHGDSSRSVVASRGRERGGDGPQVRAGEGQSAFELVAARRLGVYRHAQRALQSAARPGIRRRSGAGRARVRWPVATTSVPAAGRGMRRPNAGCTRSTAVFFDRQRTAFKESRPGFGSIQ